MAIREIIGNTTATPNPRPDWLQTDEAKADYIKNKPEILQASGDSETSIMSQKAVTELVENSVSEYVLKNDIVQTTGNSATQVMSQKATTSCVRDTQEEIVQVFPEELVDEQDVEYNAGLEQGTVGVDGIASDSTARIRTGFIPVGKGITGAFADGSTQTYWARFFDENKAFIGSAYSQADGMWNTSKTGDSPNPLFVDTITMSYPSAKFVRLVFKNVEANDPEKVDMSFTRTALKIQSEMNLDDVYARKDTTVSLDVLPKEMRTTITAAYDAGLEQGSVSNEDGSETESSIRVRTDFIPVGIGVQGSISDSSMWMYFTRVYDSQKNFIGVARVKEDGSWSGEAAAQSNPCDVDTIVKVYPNARYIRLTIYKVGSSPITPEMVGMSFTYPSLGGINEITFNDIYGAKQPYKDNDIPLEYTIDEYGHYTRGYLKLPSNYTQIGKSIPLIVFVHGSADFGHINARAMTDNYMPYYNYLRDCGYAVFDCFGWGNKYGDVGQVANTFGTPTNNRCYIEGIKYVCKNYNIDITKVYVSCKSLSGIQALALALQREIPIRAVGMLAPELDILNTRPLGYSRQCSTLLARDMEFSGDWQSVLDVDKDVYDRTAVFEYLNTQIDTLANHNPIWKKVLIANSDKMAISATKNYDNSAFRICDTPIKIWVAEDDEAVSYNQCQYLVSTLKNGGCYAELRTMPDGTGGHHSVDYDTNAPKVDSITTRLGITHTNVPTAYVELIEFFERF